MPTSHRSKRHWMYGSLGPASPVRRIDPATGEVLAVIPAHEQQQEQDQGGQQGGQKPGQGGQPQGGQNKPGQQGGQQR